MEKKVKLLIEIDEETYKQENERARFVDLIDNAPPLKIETK